MRLVMKRLLAGVRRRRPFIPKADEQITGDADQFPEDEHHHEIVREHDAEHREHEQAQAGEIAAVGAVALHVAGGVNMDRAAHARHHQRHQQAQVIQAQADVHRRNRRPSARSTRTCGSASRPRTLHEKQYITRLTTNAASDAPTEICALTRGVAAREPGDLIRLATAATSGSSRINQARLSFCSMSIRLNFIAVRSSTCAVWRLR